jgi:hypothetical protein
MTPWTRPAAFFKQSPDDWSAHIRLFTRDRARKASAAAPTPAIVRKNLIISPPSQIETLFIFSALDCSMHKRLNLLIYSMRSFCSLTGFLAAAAAVTVAAGNFK